MKLLLLVLFVSLPCSVLSQGFRIKVGNNEFPTDKIPDHVTLPEKVIRFSIKNEKPDKIPKTFVVQIGEEEQSFSTDGSYHDVKFSHDVRGLVVYILNDKREIHGKPFMLKKPKR